MSATDTVLTSGCFFSSQQIWNNIVIALAILGISLKIANWAFRRTERLHTYPSVVTSSREPQAPLLSPGGAHGIV
jgi:hypothetical protein